MNNKKVIITIIAGLFMMMPLTAQAESVTSALWVRPYIAPMETAGLIPDLLKSDKAYSDAMTREEFTELVMTYLASANPDLVRFKEEGALFTDTESAAVLAAYHMRIIAGITPAEFKPNLPISRAQAATIIFRTESVLSPEEPFAGVVGVFKDEAALPSWARIAIASTVSSGAFSGYEDGTFRPDIPLTEEQGIKLVSVLAEKRALIEINENAYLTPRFLFSKTTVTQGDTVGVNVQNYSAGDVPFVTQSIYKDFKLNSSVKGSQGIIKTDYTTKPGAYWVEYGLQGFTPEVQIITVLPSRYRVQEVTVSRTVEDSTRTAEAQREFDQVLKPSRTVSNPDKYYVDAFILPTSGRLTTEYGELRRVNGEPTPYKHAGLDIAAPLGTPIRATNRGKVVLSMYLTLTGNTIVIDHGQGLFSAYYHMSERLVVKDAIIERGATIGKMGSTGFSTASHLHFAMSRYNTAIDPGYLIYGKAVTKANYKGLFE